MTTKESTELDNARAAARGGMAEALLIASESKTEPAHAIAELLGLATYSLAMNGTSAQGILRMVAISLDWADEDRKNQQE
jgi:hypothetical protein